MKQYKTAIILPSHNEADSIGQVTARVDEGLAHLGLSEQSLLINTDNSPDCATQEAFATVPTRTTKQTIATRGIGKGDNIFAGIAVGKTYGAERFCMFDTDLTSFEPAWVERFLGGLAAGADLVTPEYARYWIEGGTTNHLCAPVLYALTGRYVAQPIAGDFAFSRRLADLLTAQPATEDQRRYGIDISLTASALFANLPIAQIPLAQKIHKPSFDKTTATYLGAASALFDAVQQYGTSGRQAEQAEGDISLRLLDAPRIDPDKLARRTLEAQDVLGPIVTPLTTDAWVEILAEHTERAVAGKASGRQLAESLLPYFMLRTVDFLDEQRSGGEAGVIIAGQARKLRERLLY